MINQVELVEQLVLEYQNNTNGSAEKLLKEYELFMNKYIDVIYHGKAHIENYSIKSFTRLFLKENKYVTNVAHVNRKPSLIQMFSYTAEYIQELFSHMEHSDIVNVLNMVMLTFASKYKKRDDKPRFHAYVNSFYHFEVYHALKVYIHDLSHINMMNNNIYDDDIYGNYDKDINENILDIKYPCFLSEGDEIDDSWVVGYTSHIFNTLPQRERELIKMHYIDKLSDRAIAEKFNVCMLTIYRRRTAAHERITKKALSLKLIRGD